MTEQFTTPQELPVCEEDGMSAVEEMVPSEGLPEETVLQTSNETEMTPMEEPPSLVEGMVKTAYKATAVWHKNKKISALWSINQDRNSWINVSGLNWKKLANNSSSAVVALTMLASHAKQSGRTTNLKEESEKIIEMYVW
jgi:hypothetical protein